MGRRSHKPDTATRRQVEALAGYGVPEKDIAGVIDVDPKTLRKHYRGELDHGHVKANARVAENLYKRATGEGREAVTAAIFWLKTRAGWKEAPNAASAVDPTKVVIIRWGDQASAEAAPHAGQPRTQGGSPLIEHSDSRH
jgi:hypothetical protein